MAWNEPGGDKKDPWGSGGNEGPPDLDEMARKMRERVFEPFYTTKAKGSGLGLHAVRMMVERDGGSVAIEDNPSGGTRVAVEWPLARTEEDEHGTNTDR